MKVQKFTRKRYQPSIILCWLLFTSFLLPQASASPHGEIEKIGLEEAFLRISEKYHAYFNYDRSITMDIEVDYKDDLHHSLDEALSYVLKNTDLGYRIYDERYVVVFQNNDQGIESLKNMIGHMQGLVQERENNKRRQVAPSLPRLQTLSTNELYNKRIVFNVSGTVTDPDGEPLIGVNIQVKGTDKGTSTDFEGKFNLEDVNENAILVFSYIGYQTQEVAVNGRNNISVELISDSEMLKEVVVVGYGTQKKQELTNAVVNLNEEDFIAGSFNNPIQLIDGKVAGLTLGTNAAADPNSGPSLQIRGVASVNAGTGPLVVIDGVPGMDLNAVPRNEIESISVLKDGASAAIYGARGANGVILVTTKKGKKGQSLVSYDGYVAVNTVARKPNILSAKEYVAFGRSNDFDPDQVDNLPYESNFYDELINDLSIENYHNLTLSSGSEKSNFRLSMIFKDAEGLDIVSKRKEYGAKLNFNQNIFEDLDIFGNLYANKTDRNYTNYVAFRQAIKVQPTEPIFDPDDPNKYFIFGGHDYYNPVALLNTDESLGQNTILSGDINVRWNILENLNSTLMVAENNISGSSYAYSSSESRNSKDNQYAGRASRGSSANKTRTLEWVNNYYLDWSEHSVKVLGGYSFQELVYEEFSAWNADFPSDALKWNNLGAGVWHSSSGGQVNPSSSKSLSRLIAFFGRINYDYKGTYFVSGSLRREGSSKFGANNKWGVFSGVSGGWLVSNMDFAKGIPFIDNLKLRASYGTTGRQDIASLLSIPTYGIHSSYNLNGTWLQAWGPSGNQNPDLKWEVGINTNIGIDFTLLDERLSVSLDIYKRKTEDLLFYSPASKPPFIYGSVWRNIGSIENKGIEWIVNWEVVRGRDFQYNTSLVGGYGTSKMLTIDNESTGGETTFIDQYHLPAPGIPGPIVRLEEGQDIGSFHMYRHAGIDEEGNFLIYNKDGEVIKSTEKTIDDKQYVGNGIPDVVLSWTNSLRYKNFDLSLYFKGAFQWDVVNLHQMYYGLINSPGNVLKDAYGKNAEILAEKEASSYFMESGDYLNLHNFSLGYTVDSQQSIGVFKKLRIGLAARNLFTLTKFTGLDITQLEINGLTPGIQTLDFYPSSRSFTISLQATF